MTTWLPAPQFLGIALTWLSATAIGEAAAPVDGLVGHWKLRGDARDSSPNGLHGKNHGVDLATGGFNGTGGYVEVPHAPALNFGKAGFSASVWIHTDREMSDVPGGVLDKFDARHRTGFTLALGASNAGYNSTGNARHVQFGIDAAQPGIWTDCGLPGGGKSHSSDALTVFEGSLYAGTTDAADASDWAHVYRYAGGQEWEDCGRLGTARTCGVYALVVHDGALYAATSASHGRQPATMSPGSVYRYRGGKQWENIGQPGAHYRLNCLASYRGGLYAGGFNIGSPKGYCYVYEGGTRWRVAGEFPGAPHTFAVHDGKLYAAYPKGEVWSFDGTTWQGLGNPYGTLEACNQIHAMGTFHGELHVGTWPEGKVAVWRGGKWIDRGRLGDATEVIALTVYNGSLYGGTIPRAEVFRYESGDRWMSVRRLFDPPGFEPVPVGSRDAAGVTNWTRASSLAVFGGKLFTSTATCYRRNLVAPFPDEMRGRVYAYSAGANVTHDRDLGPGWKHLVAVRDERQLRIYVDGRLTATAELAEPAIDVANDAPLRIGGGEQDTFYGRLRDVRLYNRKLREPEIEALFEDGKRANQ
jgi:hypothetical protein